MNAAEILTGLEAIGSESCRRIYKNHGAKEPLFGVKVQDLKGLQKKLKTNHPLTLELYGTGNADAQYLAGLIAEEQQITAPDLRRWAAQASWYMVSEYTLARLAAESVHGWQLAAEWIAAPEPHLQATGWYTLCSLLSITPGDQLEKRSCRRCCNR